MELIYNGGFANAQLSGWQTTGTVIFVANNGNDQLGCAQLISGTIEQLIWVERPLTYTLAIAHQGAGGDDIDVYLLNQDGSVVYNNIITPGIAWATTSMTIKLSEGQYTLQVTSSSAAIDDITLAHIPATRQALALAAHAELSDLATQLSISYATSGTRTEGDYTEAVTMALRETGAVHPKTGLPDVRYLDPEDVSTVVRQIAYHMLSVLHNKASLLPTSSTTGPVTDRYSLLGALEKRMGILPGMGATSRSAVTSRRLIHTDG